MDDFGYNQGWRNEKGLRMMADVNDDGKADIVAFGNNGVSVAISNGSDFEKAQADGLMIWVMIRDGEMIHTLIEHPM